MTDYYHRGVHASATWHGKENAVIDMPDAEAMIRAAEEVDAWPINLRLANMATVDGLDVVGCSAVVGCYQHGPERVLGTVGARYQPTDLPGWRALMAAVVDAGGQPDGAFSLDPGQRGVGSRALACFKVGSHNGFGSYLNVADSFDGSLLLAVGGSTIRTVCHNTMSAWFHGSAKAEGDHREGEGAAKIRHTGDMEAKLGWLRDSVGKAIKSGEAVKDVYNRLAQIPATDAIKDAIMDAAFPLPDKAGRGKSRMENLRNALDVAMAKPENREGGSVAEVWNGLTYLVDREADGSERAVRGGASPVDSMLFGSRGKRVEQIRELMVGVLDRMGKTIYTTVPDAIGMGAAPDQIGRSILDSMLDG